MKKIIFVISFFVVLFLSTYLILSGSLPFLKIPQPKIASKLIAIEDPLVIELDAPAVNHTIESSFSISPEVVGNLKFEENKLIFTPINPWRPGTSYKTTFKGMTPSAMGFAFTDSFQTKALPKVIATTPSNDSVISPLETPIKFNLDEGDANSRLDFKIVPEFKYALAISGDRKSFEIKPEEPLKGDTRYQIVAYASYESAKDGKQWYRKEVANFQFQTVLPLKVEKIIPGDKEEEVKEFTPFKAIFNKPINTDGFENFVEITPSVAGKTEWEEDGKVMVFKPQKWADSTNYTVKIKPGLQAKDKSYVEQEFLASFKSFDSSGLTSKTASAAKDPYKKEGKYIDINLTKQIMSIFSGGTNMGNFRISTGKRGMNTPAGDFSIMNKRKRAWSKKYKLFMPYFMGFTSQGHGIHELPEWPSGYKEGANHLGIPVSHGCVRLGVGPAEIVYHFADIGTLVHIHY